MRERLVLVLRVECIDILQHTEATTGSLGRVLQEFRRLYVGQVLVQVVELVIHALQQVLAESHTFWWWPVAEFGDVKGVQERSEMVEVYASGWRQAQIGR